MLMTKEKTKINYKQCFGYILLILGNILFFFVLWLCQKYDDVQLEQLLFQLKTPVSGTGKTLVSSATIRIAGFSFLLTAIEMFLYRLLSGRMKKMFQNTKWYIQYMVGKSCDFWKKALLPFGLAMLIFSISFFCITLHVPYYLHTILTQSDFIQENYVDPNTVSMKFPEKKRNLIYIILESMESTYSQGLDEDYIPELTALAEENINFSNNQKIGGAVPFVGTTWTAAGMVAQTSGTIIKVPVIGESYGSDESFLPGVVSLGEILQKEGYRETLLLGSDAAFASRDVYFTENGNYDILDIKAMKKQGRLPEDYDVWWGYEDEKLFAFAKEELTRLGAMDEPFYFTMLTADTHFPDGYHCRLCEDIYESQYANVLRCSSRQVQEMLNWIKEQPFYENTTIVISGDHLTMDPKFLVELDPEYQRTVYNCYINAAATPVFEKDRVFGTFDLFPTTLAALGVEISGDRLGLGTNLFSDSQTLAERYGQDVLDNELQKKSEFYNKALLQLEQRQ